MLAASGELETTTADGRKRRDLSVALPSSTKVRVKLARGHNIVIAKQKSLPELQCSWARGVTGTRLASPRRECAIHMVLTSIEYGEQVREECGG